MTKYLPHGTDFSIGGDLVGGLISITVPDRSRGEAETTDSDSGFDRAWVAALREGGTVELSFRHDPDDVGQLALESNYTTDGTGSIESCILRLPDIATVAAGRRNYTFNGFVTTPPAGDLDLVGDEVAEQTCTIKVAGPVTITNV